MNEIKIYLNPSGSTAELYKDFNLYQESYRNVQITVYVPTAILYENADGTYLNAVKTGAIMTAPNGAKVTTKSFNAEFVKTVTHNDIEYAVYTQIMPKEYVLYAGTQIIVCNVLSIDNTNASKPQILSVVTSQITPLTVLASAYLDNDEPLDPTEAEVIVGFINSLQKRLNDGEYVTRALYAWSADYTYGADELVSYPQKGQYGAIIKSLIAENKKNPYENGEINSQYWAEIIDFNILNGLYGLRAQIEEALKQSQTNAAAAGQSAQSAANSSQNAANSATAAQQAAESIKASANYLESIKAGTTAVPKAVADETGANIAEQFTDINDKIPSTASAENQLADKSFVNSSINNMAAFYITSNAAGDAFPTRSSLLNATTYYYGGQPRTPTQNDYAIVLADESQPQGVDGTYPTTRYSYQGGEWAFQYVVNNTSLTQAQVDAINSGITAELVDTISKGNVLSVNGQTGAVTITPANIGAVNKAGDTMTGPLQLNKALLSKNGNNPVYILPESSFTSLGVEPIDYEYFKELLKWICQQYPYVNGGVWFGKVTPNSEGTVIISIYSTSNVNSEGIPQYSSGSYIGLSRSVVRFGTLNYEYMYSSMDVDSYVKKSGDTMTGALAIEAENYASLYLKTTSNNEKLILEKSSGQAYFVFRDEYGNNESVTYLPRRNGTITINEVLGKDFEYNSSFPSGFYDNAFTTYDKCFVCGNGNDKAVIQYDYSTGWHFRVSNNGQESMDVNLLNAYGQLIDGNTRVWSNNNRPTAPKYTNGVATNNINQTDTVTDYYRTYDGSFWYRKWSSGWKECGGVITGAGDFAYTFPQNFSFEYSNYTITFGFNNTSSNDSVTVKNMSAWNKTATGFTTRNSSSSGTYKSFYACGF